jgi:hypothetical protein
VAEDRIRARGRRALLSAGAATAWARPWPDYLVIGTKRGGTTSIFNYLLSHPDVVPMWPARRTKSSHYYDRHYARGSRWFRGHFSTAVNRSVRAALHHTRPVTGEASPYYLYHPTAADRVSSDLPGVKIVVMLRNPVDRAYSHYWERVDNGVEPLGFEAALAAEPDRLAPELRRMSADPLYYSQAHDFWSYRDRGVYAPQLARWLDRFDRTQILILRSEDFYADQQSIVDTLSDFLGIRHHAMPPKAHHNHRPAPAMNPDTRAELAEFYTPHNEALYRLVGRDFEWQ